MAWFNTYKTKFSDCSLEEQLDILNGKMLIAKCSTWNLVIPESPSDPPLTTSDLAYGLSLLKEYSYLRFHDIYFLADVVQEGTFKYNFFYFLMFLQRKIFGIDIMI